MLSLTLPVIIAAASLAADPAPRVVTFAQQDMSFFITSVGSGDGANLGGLEGADKHCAMLAEAAGVRGKTWHAYLSQQAVGGKSAINARDRIGKGPWKNAKGVVVATSVEDLHSDANKLSKDNSLTEKGAVVNGRGDTPNINAVAHPGSQGAATSLPAVAATAHYRHAEFIVCGRFFDFNLERCTGDIACGRTPFRRGSSKTSLALTHERHLPASRLPGQLHGREQHRRRHQGHRGAGAERQNPLSQAAPATRLRCLRGRHGPAAHRGREHRPPQVGRPLGQFLFADRLQGGGRAADLGHVGPGVGGGRVGEQPLDGGEFGAGEFAEGVGGEEDVAVLAGLGVVVVHGLGLLRKRCKRVGWMVQAVASAAKSPRIAG